MTMTMTMTMMMTMMLMMVMVGEKSRDVLEQHPEYLLKQEDSS